MPSPCIHVLGKETHEGKISLGIFLTRYDAERCLGELVHLYAKSHSGRFPYRIDTFDLSSDADKNLFGRMYPQSAFAFRLGAA